MKTPEWLKKIFSTPAQDAPPSSPNAPSTPLQPAPVTPAPAPTNQAMRVLGLDVARYQDKLDPIEMKQLKARGYEFVHAKVTDGLAGVDAYYKIHRANAKAAGMIFGAYHFLRFGHDPVAQAKNFHKNAGRVRGELPPVLDVEWDRYTLNQKYGEKKRMDVWAEEHAMKCTQAIMDLFGVRPMIYTNAYFWPPAVKYPEFWKQFRCWIPSYADILNPGGVHHIADLSPEEIMRAGVGVKVPPPWKQWDFWQDDDDLAIGDVKAIDTNVFRGSLDDLRRIANQ